MNAKVICSQKLTGDDEMFLCRQLHTSGPLQRAVESVGDTVPIDDTCHPISVSGAAQTESGMHTTDSTQHTIHAFLQYSSIVVLICFPGRRRFGWDVSEGNGEEARTADSLRSFPVDS